MKKSCQYCGRIHDVKYDCGFKPVKIQSRTEYDKFRNTSAWRKKREEIKERDNYLCQICFRNLYDTINKLNHANIEVHHAEKLNENYSKRLDDDNLLSVCERHHKMCDAGIIPYVEVKRIICEQIAPPRV